MATKKYLELIEFTQEELDNELNETVVHFEKLKFDHAIKGLDNPVSLQEIRRDIARLKSEIRRRELDSMTADEVQKRSKIRFRRKKR